MKSSVSYRKTKWRHQIMQPSTIPNYNRTDLNAILLTITSLKQIEWTEFIVKWTQDSPLLTIWRNQLRTGLTSFTTERNNGIVTGSIDKRSCQIKRGVKLIWANQTGVKKLHFCDVWTGSDIGGGFFGERFWNDTLFSTWRVLDGFPHC